MTQNAVVTNQTRQTTIDGLPETEMVHELVKLYAEVSIRVQRRNDKGQLATVHGQQRIKTEQLSTIDSWLQAESGGGDYFIIVRPPGDIGNVLMKFNVRVEGPPKSPRQRTGAPVPMGGFQDGDNYPTAAPSSRWAEGLMDEHARQTYLHGVPPAPGATVASDQLAIHQMQEMKAMSAKLQEELRHERMERERIARESEKQLDIMRQEATEARHRADMEMLRTQMAARDSETKILLEAQRNQKPDKSMPEMIAAAAAFAAPFAPVLAALVTSSREGATRAMEVQQQGVQALMQATLEQANRPDPMTEMFKTMGPLLMPFLSSMMESKSPAAQAAVFSSLAEQQLNSVAMMAQLIESFAGGDKEEPWWLPMVKETLGGAVRMGEAMLEANNASAQQSQAQQKQLMAAAQQYVSPAFGPPTVLSTVLGQEPPQVHAASTPQAAAPAPQKSSVSGLAAMLPEDFRSPEWAKILTDIHDDNASLEETAELLASHLEHCVIFSIVPSALDGVQADPETVLRNLVQLLPIWRKNQERAEAILTMTVANLFARSADPEEVEEEGEEAAA